jgi:hypothetical protein
MAPAAQPAVVNRQEAFRRHLTRSRVVAIAQVVALLCAFAAETTRAARLACSRAT